VGRTKVGFINMAIDISPACDCVGFADMPIVPNLGVFASTDPVALDQATVHKAMQARGMPGSAAEDYGATEPGAHKFTAASAVRVPDLSEEIQIRTGAIIGLGSREYELVQPKQPADRRFWAFPDARPQRGRMGPLYDQDNPFPVERHGGRGYHREETVDLERVSTDAE
jgi:hypothetical protein